MKNVLKCIYWNFFSCRLLQPDQPDLRNNLRLLHRDLMPDHVRWSQVRVLVGWRLQIQETHTTARTSLHRAFDGLGWSTDQRRAPVPRQCRSVTCRIPYINWRLILITFLIFLWCHRYSVPKDVSQSVQEDSDPTFQGICARLHPPLWSASGHRSWGSRQHLLQALLLFRPSVWPSRRPGAWAASRNDITHLQGSADDSDHHRLALSTVEFSFIEWPRLCFFKIFILYLNNPVCWFCFFRQLARALRRPLSAYPVNRSLQSYYITSREVLLSPNLCNNCCSNKKLASNIVPCIISIHS